VAPAAERQYRYPDKEMTPQHARPNFSRRALAVRGSSRRVRGIGWRGGSQQLVFTRRSAACRQIRRGATLAEIQNVLGPGIGPERSRQPGWLFFGGDAVREDSFIRARIRPDGVVTELWCTDTRDSWNP
jgi:hypothetical protein